MGWPATEDHSTAQTYSNCTGIWLGSTAAVDLSISFGLWYTLRVRLQRSQSFIANSLLRSFLVTTLQTAAYTAFFAAGGLAFAILAIVKEQNAATFDLVSSGCCRTTLMHSLFQTGVAAILNAELR